MLDLAPIRAVSFDCYGTLIDWQTGILAAVRRVPTSRGARLSDEEFIVRFADAEREAERPPYRPYKEVLRRVMGAIVAGEPDPETADALWRSIGDWPVFSDTPGALRELQARFKIAVVSNIDDDLFALTRPKLGVVPDVVVTAQQVCSYKPERAHFEELPRRLSLRPDQILHVAESRYHDIEPASAMGFPTAWVNRMGKALSASGPAVGGGEAAIVVRSLSELVEIIAG